jgi:hypothetical protein
MQNSREPPSFDKNFKGMNKSVDSSFLFGVERATPHSLITTKLHSSNPKTPVGGHPTPSMIVN